MTYLLRCPPGAIVAHRGCSSEAPENTLAAYEKAAERGIGWIETDVRMTRDGQGIMMHDPFVDRTTNGTGNVHEMTAAEIGRLDASRIMPEFGSIGVPTVEQAIETCLGKGLGMALEVKSVTGREMEDGRAVGEMLNRTWPKTNDQLIIASFYPASLLALRSVAPWVQLALATDYVPKDPRPYIELLGIGCFMVQGLHALAAGVDHLLAAGAHVSGATVNDQPTAQMLYDMGVHTIMTDMPDLMGQTK